VIALAANGRATSVEARLGGFRLSPPARRVTLHLRAADGSYAGPVVVGGTRRTAILGLRAGARLGRLRVRRGYARPTQPLRRRWIDAGRWARARKGVPIGARVFGRVRSLRPRGSVPGDFDLDGIPEPLDVDDDGDLILDNIDRSSAAGAAQLAPEFSIGSGLGLGLTETDTAHANRGFLLIHLRPR